jgi:hypothetical protein
MYRFSEHSLAIERGRCKQSCLLRETGNVHTAQKLRWKPPAKCMNILETPVSVG